MVVMLAISSERLSSFLPEFHRLLEGFSYLPGNRYSDFVESDSVANFGLGGLVAGGVPIDDPETESSPYTFYWFFKAFIIAFAVIGTIFMRFVKKRKPESDEAVVEKEQEQV